MAKRKALPKQKRQGLMAEKIRGNMKIKKVRPTFRKRITEIAAQQSIKDKAKIADSWLNRVIDFFKPGYIFRKIMAYDVKTSASIAAMTKRVSHGAVGGK
jgi:hypothetical protein